MPVYRIGWVGQESSESQVLSFDKILTEQELSGYVHQATTNALTHVINHRDNGFFYNEEGPSFSDIYTRVIEELELLGFRHRELLRSGHREFDAEWCCYRGEDPLCVDRYHGHDAKLHYQPEDIDLRKSIPQEVKEQILDISRQRLE